MIHKETVPNQPLQLTAAVFRLFKRQPANDGFRLVTRFSRIAAATELWSFVRSARDDTNTEGHHQQNYLGGGTDFTPFRWRSQAAADAHVRLRNTEGI